MADPPPPPVTSPRALPAPGELFAGRYRVERVIGSGGMGVVLEATHLHLDERVAIKMIIPALAGDGSLALRFLREGRASVKIRSEHVARVLDVATLEDGTPYMVMEYLEGSDLSAVLEQRGPLPVALAVDYVLQACEAIAEAHGRGIVHRDVKPSNLFLTRRPDGTECIKVLDFGISKTISPASGPQLAMTKTNAVMGSPLYMAPEQMRSSRAVDARCDIWSIGIILQELLTGEPPFSATTMPELCAIILQDAPRDLRELRPETPQGLVATILRCLEKEPARRYPDLAELARAASPFGTEGARASAERIARLLSSRNAPQAAAPDPPAKEAKVDPSPPSVGFVPAVTGATWETRARSRARRRLWLMGGGGAAAALLAIGVFAALRAQRTSDPTTGPSPSTSENVVAAPSTTAPPTAASLPTPSPSASAVENPAPTVSTPPAPPPPTTPTATASASAHPPPRPIALPSPRAPRPVTPHPPSSLPTGFATSRQE